MGDMNLDFLPFRRASFQKITKPARITSTSATIIDHICTNMSPNNYNTITGMT